MNQQQQPKTIDSILAVYRSHKDHESLVPDDYLRIIAYYDNQGDEDNALFCTGVFTSRYSKSILAGAFTEIGIIAFAENRFEDAIKALTQAISIDPESKNAYVVRGMSYGLSSREDRGQKAKQDMVKAGMLARIHNGVSV